VLLAAAAAGLVLGIGLTGPRPRVVAIAPSPLDVGLAPAPPPTLLQIDSEPPGARVLVDRIERCLTPCQVGGLPSRAPTIVRLERDGYLPWTAIVDPAGAVSVHRVARLRLRPTPGEAWGAVRITGPGIAEVRQGDVELGHVTSEGLLELPAGAAVLTLVGATSTRTVAVTVPAGGVVTTSSPE
jgi:hypothetical protein